ncbi:hypothetical protein CWB99_19390 [Pseudoalteromonas rubra]|uniref:Orphan protein n=1 Tax=Pseudoalteromonas rubra TaxID=43658 RepID=A0A5S3WHB4_9GAMM|nr:DUF6702 family protein [Pseudoalteromonas rubra]TMP26147.1 hypothetical protein CWB99_19390 [Pseudoalteromonas rubra]TMP32950.1 hypothetical protein CWC00_11370 [Pseudoalteromonas rubra]
MIKGLLSVLGALLFLIGPAYAHQLKAAQTTVLFNEQTRLLEVIHRFYLHDAEHAVEHLFGGGADILRSAQTQAQFSQYVAGQFAIMSLQDRALPLADVGFEAEGKFFWVYQESAIPEQVKGLKLFNGALRELWPTQVNMVNVEGKGKVKTLYFADQADWLQVIFEH